MNNRKRRVPKDREMSHVLMQFVLFCGAVLFAAQPQAGAPNSSATRVECCGKLRCGMAAIGGETTGTTVTFDGVIWELRLPDDKSKKFAHDHHKQPVKGSGTLKRVAGTERKERWVVDVAELTEADAKSPDTGATIEIDGTLEQNNSDPEGAGFSVRSNDNISLPIVVSHNPTLSSKAKSLTSKKVRLVGRVEKIEGTSLPAKIKVIASQLDAVAVR